MIYFILFFITIFIFNISKTEDGTLKIVKSKKSYLSFFFALWILCGLRHHTVLGDATTYAQEFMGSSFEWKDFFGYFQNEIEPLFALTKDILTLFTDSYTIFFFVTSLPIALGLTYLVKEFSEDNLIVCLILFVLGFVTFTFAGVRQSMAMGFCCLSIKYIKNSKLLPFLIMIFIASGFHTMAFLFLLAYPLSKLKTGLYWWGIVLLFFILGFTRSSIINSIGTFFFGENDKYSNYFNKENTGLNFTLFFIQIIFIIIAYFYKKDMVKKDKNYNMLFNFAFVGLCFQSLTPIIGEFFRASLFYSFSIAFLIPKAINAEKNEKFSFILKLGAIGMCVLYLFILTDLPKTYFTFWGKP